MDQRGFGLVALSDDGDHLVNIEQHQLAAFQNMDAVEHLVQTVLRTTQNCRLAKLDPLGEHVAHRLLHRSAVDTHHRQVDRRRGLQTGVRQQSRDEFLLFDGAGFGFKHQTHSRVFAGLVAHHIEYRQNSGFELILLRAQGFFAGLDFGVGELFNFFEHALAAHAGGQFVHYQLPLTARKVFDHPASAHF